MVKIERRKQHIGASVSHRSALWYLKLKRNQKLEICIKNVYSKVVTAGQIKLCFLKKKDQNFQSRKYLLIPISYIRSSRVAGRSFYATIIWITFGIIAGISSWTHKRHSSLSGKGMAETDRMKRFQSVWQNGQAIHNDFIMYIMISGVNRLWELHILRASSARLLY